MTNLISDEAVTGATGRDWAGWRGYLDGIGAAALDHKAIAARLSAVGVPGWWAQMVTVEYERMIGRRGVGQRCDGAFSASASRTIAGDKDGALARWRALVDDMAEFGGIACDGKPRVSASGNWRYWKADFEDGSRVSVNICDKAGGKASLGVSHDKIADLAAAERWKAVWKALLARL
jgi:hypothetical protein